MSNARKCDICGQFYEVPDHEMFLNEPWLNTSMVRIMRLKGNNPVSDRFDDMKFDSCDKCLQDVLDYILSRAADSAPVKEVNEQQCFTIKNLAVNCHDIRSLHVPEGAIVDKVLNHLLDKVLDGEINNDRDALMEEAKYYVAEGRHWQFRM